MERQYVQLVRMQPGSLLLGFATTIHFIPNLRTLMHITKTVPVLNSTACSPAKKQALSLITRRSALRYAGYW